MANRVPFNANVDPATQEHIKTAAEKMGVSEGAVIDIWALWNNLETTSINPELRRAAGSLKILIKANGKGGSEKRRGK